MDAGFLDNSEWFNRKRPRFDQAVTKYVDNTLYSFIGSWQCKAFPESALPVTTPQQDVPMRGIQMMYSGTNDVSIVSNKGRWKRMFIRGFVTPPFGYDDAMIARFVVAYDRNPPRDFNASFSDVFKTQVSNTTKLSDVMSYANLESSERFQILFDKIWFFDAQSADTQNFRGNFPYVTPIENVNNVPPTVVGDQPGYQINFNIPLDNDGNIFLAGDKLQSNQVYYKATSQQFEEMVELDLPFVSDVNDGNLPDASSGRICYGFVWNYEINPFTTVPWPEDWVPAQRPKLTCQMRFEYDDGKPTYPRNK